MSKKYQRKKMKKSDVIITILLVLSLIIIGFLGYMCGRTTVPTEVIKTDTTTIHDTLWKDTTIYEKQLVPKKIVEIKRDTIYGDTLELVTESKEYEKSLISGKDTADLKVYVSGIKPSLDSLEMRLKTHTEVNTVEITKYVQKKKTFKDRFHLGLQVGYGLGLQSRKFDSYVGFGVSFDL